MISLFDCSQSCPQKKDDKALRLWRVLFLEFFSIFPIHKSLCISWKHMKSARKRATALVLKSKRDDSIIDPLKKGILNCCCYCVVFSSCWPQAAPSRPVLRRKLMVDSLLKSPRARYQTKLLFGTGPNQSWDTFFLISLILSVMILYTPPGVIFRLVHPRAQLKSRPLTII